MNITNKLVPSRRFQEFKDAPAWERYKVEDFFPEIFSGNRLPKDALREGPIPYVIAQTHNNGIYMTIQQNTVDYHGNPMKLFQAPSLTFSIDNPDAIFIQEKPFFTSNIMRVLHKNGFRREYYTFFLESIKKLTTSYNWGLKFSGPVVMKSSINIPIDKSNRSINFVEMEKIGKYIQNLDKLIILRQHKLEKLKELKTSYLAEIFPVKGERKPKRRFLGFTEAWEQRELFEYVLKIIDFRGRTPRKLGLDWSDEGYLALSALNVKNGYIDESLDAHYGDQELYDKWMKGNELHKGQVLFTTEAPMGNVAQIPDNKGYILSQRTIAFEVNENYIAENYLAVVLKTPSVFNFLLTLSSGGTAKGVSQKSMSELSIPVPIEISEQKKIATFFRKLDSLITLHQRKLEKLQNIKKAYLYEMFPRMERE